MSYSLSEFVTDVNESLTRDSGPAGREQVRANLERLLAEPDFIAHIRGLDIAEGVKVLHKEKGLGYLILAHATREGAGRHAPHNHGASWAIYGQVTNHTDMTEWERVNAGGDKAELKVARAYRLTPGQAGIYQNGAIHSVENEPGTRIIRITGVDLDTIERERFDPATGQVSKLVKTA